MTFMANRNRAEIESLIGFFANKRALETDLSESPSLRWLFRRPVRIGWPARFANKLKSSRMIAEERNDTKTRSMGDAVARRRI